MAFDAMYLSAVLAEIRQLGECRVEKIHQPSRDTVLFHLKHREGRAKLLLAANPAAPRLHLTTASPENPAEPPMFCMLLRKHIGSARLTAVSQLPMERCAVFTFDCIDEMGDAVQKKLVAELMRGSSIVCGASAWTAVLSARRCPDFTISCRSRWKKPTPRTGHRQNFCKCCPNPVRICSVIG